MAVHGMSLVNAQRDCLQENVRKINVTLSFVETELGDTTQEFLFTTPFSAAQPENPDTVICKSTNRNQSTSQVLNSSHFFPLGLDDLTRKRQNRGVMTSVTPPWSNGRMTKAHSGPGQGKPLTRGRFEASTPFLRLSERRDERETSGALSIDRAK